MLEGSSLVIEHFVPGLYDTCDAKKSNGMSTHGKGYKKI